MKKSVLLFFLFLSALWFVFNSNASGAGQFQGVDRTGSPLSPGSCGECHGQGTYNPSLDITLLDGTNPVSAYVPGKQYTLRFSVNPANGTPGGYGYQATVLDSKNAQAGTLGAAPSGQRVITLGGRQYAEQTRRAGSGVFQMPWTAPAVGTGSVVIYSTGVAVNGTGSNGGDNHASNKLTLTETTVSSLSAAKTLNAQLKVYPNPAVEFARLDIQGKLENASLWVNLLDVQGRILQNKKVQHQGENTQIELDVKNLPQGQYWVQVSDGSRTKTIALVK